MANSRIKRSYTLFCIQIQIKINALVVLIGVKVIYTGKYSSNYGTIYVLFVTQL